MLRNHRPIVFIGSSTEGEDIAKALLSNLEKCSEPQIWSQGVFGLGQGYLESLTLAANRADFAVLVMTPDDFVECRGSLNHIPRDNIVLELGLFIGALGRDRTIMMHEKEANIKLPTDLSGVMAATFSRSDRLGLSASVAPAAILIEGRINHIGFRAYNRRYLLTGLWDYSVYDAKGKHIWGGECEISVNGDEINIKGLRLWDKRRGRMQSLVGLVWRTQWVYLSHGYELCFEHIINLSTGPARGLCTLNINNSYDRMQGAFYYVPPQTEYGRVVFSRKLDSANANDTA